MRILLLQFSILFLVCQYGFSKTISRTTELLSEKDNENCNDCVNVSESEFICDCYSIKELNNSIIPSLPLSIFILNQTQVAVLKNSTFENKSIETINIKNNDKLKTIQADAFKGLVGLKYLFIDNNKIRMNGLLDPVLQIPNLFVPFRNIATLEVLSLRQNDIRNDELASLTVDLEERVNILPYLKVLDLSGNTLKFIDSSILSPLRYSPLSHLSIANSQLHPTNGVTKGMYYGKINTN